MAARLHHEFNARLEATELPERPDYERANASARVGGQCPPDGCQEGLPVMTRSASPR